MKLMTAGLPKGSNSYGNRMIIVPINAMSNVIGYRGRVIARKSSSYRYHSTGSARTEVNVIGKLEKLYFRSEGNKNLVVDRNLYKLLCDKVLFLIAYQKDEKVLSKSQKDIFEDDENIGKDIKKLFEVEDVFEDDENIGKDIEKLFDESKKDEDS